MQIEFRSQFLIISSFFKSLKVVLINMVIILMMSVKMATLGLKIKVFCDKNYYVIISVYNVTNKILSPDSIYIVNVDMLPN